MTTLAQVRATNLSLLAKTFASRALFAKAAGLAASQVSDLCVPDEQGCLRKHMGEKLARRIESRLNLPKYWFDHAREELELFVPAATALLPEQEEPVDMEGLSDLQRAFVRTAIKLAHQGDLTDKQCVEILSTWQDKLDR